MQKTKLNRFISKYNLNGNVNSVKWTSKDDALSTTFVTSDKSSGSCNVTILTILPFDKICTKSASRCSKIL